MAVVPACFVPCRCNKIVVMAALCEIGTQLAQIARMQPDATILTRDCDAIFTMTKVCFGMRPKLGWAAAKGCKMAATNLLVCCWQRRIEKAPRAAMSRQHDL